MDYSGQVMANSISKNTLAKTGSDFAKEKERRLYSSKYAGTYLASSKNKVKLPVQTVVPGSPEQ